MNIKKCYTILPLISFLVFPAFSSIKQTREEGIKFIKSRLLDVSSATYQLKPSVKGRDYELCNNSSFRIERTRLGCAEKNGEKIVILSSRPYEDTKLEPAEKEKTSCHFWGSNHEIVPGEECEKGKLAVMAVEL